MNIALKNKLLKKLKKELNQINKTRNVKIYIDTLCSFTENEKIIKKYKNN